MYSLTVLLARSLTGLVSCGSSEGESVPCFCPGFWLLPAILYIPWFVDVSLQSLLPSFCGILHVCLNIFFLCAQFLSSSKDTSYWIRVHPNPVWPHLNLLHLQRPYFQIKPYTWVPGFRIGIYLLGWYISTHNSSGRTWWNSRNVHYSLGNNKHTLSFQSVYLFIWIKGTS